MSSTQYIKVLIYSINVLNTNFPTLKVISLLNLRSLYRDQCTMTLGLTFERRKQKFRRKHYDARAQSSRQILSKFSKYSIYWVISLHACRGKGLQHVLGATKRAFSLFIYSETRNIARDSRSLFWNSDYRYRFPLKSTEICSYRIQL